ncbi:hypothetical protein CC78DRAFT_521253 [Lojkania enalia]|uniref:Aminoglycoside phosphotransferase domain-containing protein n=1 Tax=Lojkania enalia TaxID=147567 RepID=A0A9P4K961_9PLEO|nr:hypothetical protein CC78DRAFT_521253 [Didymosphaeria enalia]
MSPHLQTSFWQRMGLKEGYREECLRAVQARFPAHRIEEHRDQGYCSFTLLLYPQAKTSPFVVEPPLIIQIRPEQHAFDLNIIQAANHTYGSLAPKVRSLDCALPPRLYAFEIESVCGVQFSKCLTRTQCLQSRLWTKQLNLVTAFSGLVSRAWPSQSSQPFPHTLRAHSPITENSSMLSQCRGRVGSQILSKLQKLEQHLPDSKLRRRARSVLHGIQTLKNWPVVLNHGDLIPSNIFVDDKTWEITGWVDWAEAEWLPFGTCLYSLEFFLGFMRTRRDGSEDLEFVYYDEVDVLRMFFYEYMEENVPALEGRKRELMLARDMGVLLWYGFAWDEGAIDRVVNEVDDREEVECLRKFLGASAVEEDTIRD